MDILNKEKLQEVLKRWRGHPSVTDLMDRFDKLQTYTKKKLEKEEANTGQVRVGVGKKGFKSKYTNLRY